MITYTTDQSGAQLTAQFVDNTVVIVQKDSQGNIIDNAGTITQTDSLGVESTYVDLGLSSDTTLITGCTMLKWGDFKSPACIYGCSSVSVPSGDTGAIIRSNIIQCAQSIEALARKLDATPTIVLGWVTQEHLQHIIGSSSSNLQTNSHSLGLAADVKFVRDDGTEVDPIDVVRGAYSVGYDIANPVLTFYGIAAQVLYTHLEVNLIYNKNPPLFVVYKGGGTIDTIGQEGVNNNLLNLATQSMTNAVNTNDSVGVLAMTPAFKTIGDVSDYLKIGADTLYHLNFGSAPPDDAAAENASVSGMTSIYYPTTSVTALLSNIETKLQFSSNVSDVKTSLISEYGTAVAKELEISQSQSIAIDQLQAQSMIDLSAAQNNMLGITNTNTVNLSDLTINEMDETSYDKARQYIRTHVPKKPIYSRACLIIQTPGSADKTIRFIINPMSKTVSYNNIITPQQTAAGWFLSRHGQGLINVTFSGILYDAYGIEEKQEFLKQYKDNCVDKKTTTNEFYNDSSVTLLIEGVKYFGYIAQLTMSKSPSQQYAYQYNIGFIGVSDEIQGVSTSDQQPNDGSADDSDGPPADDTTDPTPAGGDTGTTVTTPPTPPPPASTSKTAKVTASSLNVRKGPGANYAKNGKALKKGTVITVLEVKKKWLRFATSKWVCGSYTDYKF